MSTTYWLSLISLGFVLGALGQLIRSAAGWRKMMENAKDAGMSMREFFDTTYFFLTLIIGGTSGALAAYLLAEDLQDGITSEQVLGIIAAGYTGADFISGFIARFPSVTKAAPFVLNPPREGVVVFNETKPIGNDANQPSS